MYLSLGQIFFFSTTLPQYWRLIERCSSYAHLMNNFLLSLSLCPPFPFSPPLSLSLSFFGIVLWVDRILACGVKGIRVQPDLGSVQIPIDKKSAPTPGTITLADSSDSPTITQPIFFSIPPRHGSVGPHGVEGMNPFASCSLLVPCRFRREGFVELEAKASCSNSSSFIEGNDGWKYE